MDHRRIAGYDQNGTVVHRYAGIRFQFLKQSFKRGKGSIVEPVQMLRMVFRIDHPGENIVTAGTLFICFICRGKHASAVHINQLHGDRCGAKIRCQSVMHSSCIAGLYAGKPIKVLAPDERYGDVKRSIPAERIKRP